MRKTNKKGFTIVELVIVIAVIAILAAVMIPTFAGVIDKANESKALQEAQTLYKEIHAVDIADGKLDGNNGNNSSITNGEPTDTKINCKGTITTYDPDATEGAKFVYEASNGKTVTLASDGTTWTTADTTPTTGGDSTDDPADPADPTNPEG